jgi:hypothetical protein
MKAHRRSLEKRPGRTASPDEAFERLLLRLEASQDPKETRDLEKLLDMAVRRDELQIAASSSGRPVKRSDEPDARSVDRRYPSQIEDDPGTCIRDPGECKARGRTRVRY